MYSLLDYVCRHLKVCSGILENFRGDGIAALYNMYTLSAPATYTCGKDIRESNHGTLLVLERDTKGNPRNFAALGNSHLALSAVFSRGAQAGAG